MLEVVGAVVREECLQLNLVRPLAEVLQTEEAVEGTMPPWPGVEAEGMLPAVDMALGAEALDPLLAGAALLGVGHALDPADGVDAVPAVVELRVVLSILGFDVENPDQAPGCLCYLRLHVRVVDVGPEAQEQ